MKTLIWNGSPRPHGDTASMIARLKAGLHGECMQVDAYRCHISPCIDCRYCIQSRGCAIQDDMQAVYEYIQACDNVLIASPLYFSELTGPLLGVTSRLQTYYCARHFRQEKPILKPKKGAVILAGGGDGSMQRAYETGCVLLRSMNARDIHPLVYTHHTNECPAIDDLQALAGVDQIAAFFNGR